MTLYWDFANKVLITSLSLNKTVPGLIWVLHDLVSVSISLVKPKASGLGYEAETVPSGFTPVFGLKAAGSLSDPPLASASSWAVSGSTFTGSIDLNTAGLSALVDESADGFVDLVGELVLDNGSGTQRDSTQFIVRVYQDVNRAGDAPPSSTAQPGVWLPNRTTGQWHYCWLEGTPPALTIGEGVTR